jgi:hypothetical protein
MTAGAQHRVGSAKVPNLGNLQWLLDLAGDQPQVIPSNCDAPPSGVAIQLAPIDREHESPTGMPYVYPRARIYIAHGR